MFRRKRQDSTHLAGEGGRVKTARSIGDPITAQDIWDAYRYSPRAKAVNFFPNAAFHAGFDQDIDPLKLQEIWKADKYKEVFGWAVVVVKNGNVQAWNPRVNGVGAEVPQDALDEYGMPMWVRIYLNADDQSKHVDVSDNFYILRTNEGLPGWKGDSKLLCLFEILKAHREIVEKYAWYAAAQGAIKWLVKDTKAQSATQLASTKSAFGNPAGQDVYVYPDGKEIDTMSPMKNAWDPTPMLSYIDTMVAGVLGVNKHMLTGDPEGHLTSSEIALATFYARVKEYQDELLPQLLPVLAAIGAPAGIAFNDPSELPAQQQALLLRDIVGLLKSVGVPDAEVLDYVNNTLNTDFSIEEKPPQPNPFGEVPQDDENETENIDPDE